MSQAPEIFRPEYYFDMSQWGEHLLLWDGVDFVWEVLPKLEDYIQSHLEKLAKDPVLGKHVIRDATIESKFKVDTEKGPVYIGPGTTIDFGAVIYGPAILQGCELRPSAFIRGNALVLEGAVVGNSTEVKNSVIGKYAEVPHFSYVGDSVLGNAIGEGKEQKVTHIGAGGITSNLKIFRNEIVIKMPSEKELEEIGAFELEQYEPVRALAGQAYPTGLTKIGVIMGDGTDAGTQARLGPGAFIGKRCFIYDDSKISGFVPSDTIYKTRQIVEVASVEKR